MVKKRIFITSVRAFLREEVGGILRGIVGSIPKAGKRAGEGGDQPVPSTVDLPAFFGFLIFEAKMGCAGGMVIDPADTRFCKRVENGTVEFDQSLVFPKGGGTGGVEAKTAGNFRQKIVPVFVSKVAGRNFRFHIPTAKG